ncbi:hypothetical protein PR202_ga15374 [Eleusine coracana subsp. coracana]|uniref:Uncharacterized protein n=1 Tax=Eleusine coracana subsp. coracana TaxID=191504 RepID=A0AAV5CJV8_ELECO|nr:hypothetical protein PR202_ga15374 [Eleusine coracana subsp. coracana]
MDKSSIHFAKGCSNNLREEIMDILDVHNQTLNEKYLGMPLNVGIAMNGAFKYLKDRVWSTIQGWLDQCLSAGGKEVLIKAVAQAIPTYSMSCFRLPKGLCNHLTGLLRNFWWGCKDGKRKTCWVAWDDMIQLKNRNGLGFRDMELFNLALLAKQACRLLLEPTSLCARLLKAIYFPNGELLEAELGQNPSCIWRSILDGRSTLNLGLIRRIGNGESTKIWAMDWLPREGMRRPINTVSNSLQLVSELIDVAAYSWKREVLNQYFAPADVETILNILINTRRQEDFWAWHHERSDVFSVRSAYRMLAAQKANEAHPGSLDVRKAERLDDIMEHPSPIQDQGFSMEVG